MNVLITGGTGFIGSNLTLRCLAAGHRVTVLAQTNTPAEAGNRAAIEERGAVVVEGSVTDPGLVRQAVAGNEVVLHLAAVHHETHVPDRHFWEVNVEGTRRLLDIAVDHGVKRFVHASTIGVYGSEAEGEIDEDTPLRPDNIYGTTKREGEALVMSYVDHLPVTAIRIAEAYGPRDRRLLKLFRAIHKNVFVMIGKGDNRHHLIYVDDLIDGLILAAQEEQAPGRIFILAGKEFLTTNQMVAVIAEALGKTGARVRAPMWPFVAAAYLLEAALRPIGIQPPLHRRRLDFFRKDLLFSCERARTLLGFEPKTSFRDGVAATAAWYREQGLV